MALSLITAKIKSNESGGAYDFDQVFYDFNGVQISTEIFGLQDVAANDLFGRTDRQVGDLVGVIFQETTDGLNYPLIFDMIGGGLVRCSSNDATFKFLGAKMVGDGKSISTEVINDGGDEDVKTVHIGPDEANTFLITSVEVGGPGKLQDAEIDSTGHTVAVRDSSGTWHKTADQFP